MGNGRTLYAPVVAGGGDSASSDPLLEVLHHAADLVARWGDVRLGGRALQELTDVHGLPLWNAVSADVALYRVPQAIRTPRALGSMRARARRMAWSFRHRLWRAPTRNVAPPPWPGTMQFLVLSSSAYMHRDLLHPVLRAVTSSGRATAISAGFVPRERLPAVHYHDMNAFWSDRARADERTGFEQLRHGLATVRSHRRGLARALGAESHADDATLLALLESLFLVQLPPLLRHAVLARELIGRSPSIVISPDVADAQTRVTVILAKRAGIPTLELQFGGCGVASTEWRFLVADRVAAWGTSARQVMGDHGIPSERIVVTGSPRHDAMVDVNPETVRRVRNELGIPPGRQVVLFASSITQFEYGDSPDRRALAATQEAIFAAAVRARDWTLVIKPHPLEPVHETRSRAGAANNLVWADKDRDIRDLIVACDVFVSLGSTATMDAVIAHKPSICAALPGWNWSDFFVRSGAVLVAQTAEELGNHLTAATTEGAAVLASLEQARTTLLAEWAFRADGQAAERVVTLAHDLAAAG